jgi:hypothetical protein
MTTNQDKWLYNSFAVFGAIGTIVGLGTWFGAKFETLVAFLAGGGWTLVIALLVMTARTRREIERLEVECEDLREQSLEWREIADRTSDTANALIRHVIPAMPIKKTRKTK